MTNGASVAELIQQLEDILQLGFRNEFYYFNEDRFKDPDTDKLNKAVKLFIETPSAQTEGEITTALRRIKEKEKTHFKVNEIATLVHSITEKSQGQVTRNKPRQ